MICDSMIFIHLFFLSHIIFPSYHSIPHQILPALAYLLSHNNTSVVIDVCWALSYLTDGNSERIQTVIDAGVVPKLVQHLGSGLKIVVSSL